MSYQQLIFLEVGGKRVFFLKERTGDILLRLCIRVLEEKYRQSFVFFEYEVSLEISRIYKRISIRKWGFSVKFCMCGSIYVFFFFLRRRFVLGCDRFFGFLWNGGVEVFIFLKFFEFLYLQQRSLVVQRFFCLGLIQC